jgi:hypothetical protein
VLPHRGSAAGKAMGQNGSAFLRSYGLIHIDLNRMSVDIQYLCLRDYFCCGLSGMTCTKYCEQNKADLQESKGCHFGHYFDHNPMQKIWPKLT